MMPSRGFNFAGSVLCRLQYNSNLRSSGLRQISTGNRVVKHTLLSSSYQARLLQTQWRVQTHSQSPFSLFAPRHASTAPAPPPRSDSTTFGTSTDEFAISPQDPFISSDFTPITEHIGFLKELGLDYGWGPTALMQTFLEHVHIWTGTPWWASIVLTSLALRLVLVKPYINAADTTARMTIVGPHIQPIKDRVSAAQANKDRQAMLIATQEMQGVYRNAGVKAWKLFVPPILQIPLGFGIFRLLRGMTALPVPGLEDGGLAWMKDLTMSDPFFILPVVTVAAFHYTVKKGGEAGTTAAVNPAVQNAMLYIFPGVTGLFMLFWPGCIQLTICFTSLLSLTQGYLFRQNWVRDRIGIQRLPDKPKPTSSSSSSSTTPYTGTMNVYKAPTPSSSSAPAKKTGFLSSTFADVKNTASEISRSAKKTAGMDDTKKPGRRTPAELRRAQAYEEKRRREIAQEKFEMEQAREEKYKRSWKRKGKGRDL